MTVVAVSVLVTFLIVRVAYKITKKEAESKADEYIAHLTSNLELPVWNVDYKLVTAIAQSYMNSGLLMQLEIQSLNNDIVFSKKKSNDQNIIKRKSKIVHEGREIGNISLGLSLRSYRQKIRQLVWASILIGGLAAGMAHEINNPLAGIMQNTDVVINRLTGDMPANHRAADSAGISMDAVRSFMAARNIVDMLQNVRESGLRASRIVTSMLGFARKSESRKVLADVANLLDQALVLAENDYDLRKKHDFRKIEIVREYAPDLPAIPCDEIKIQQVFLNILRNGAEVMTESKDRVSRFVLRTGTDGEMVRIEIEDNGSGMDDSIRKRIFEPFFTTKGVGIGTGLGMSVSYFIVSENHGGTMEAESVPGGGTKLIIRLPLAG